MSQRSRAIRLTRIHAMNWYGYQDTLPVNGNLVLAGVTGSGKSILMDLIMLVLVGPEKARHHFNRSATGSQSDRTIKGYCLLDTKREENGQPQYFHDKGVTSFLALEFTWPDGKRVETWGMRIEFRNTAENDGHITPFFCQGVLQKEDFLVVSPDDGKKRMRDLPGFRALVEARKGRTFPSSREYLRDMHNSAHLNFNRDVLDRLLPSAMSFTNLKSFDDFCRKFVLPGEAVPVQDVVTSYRDFESYEKELQQLRAQLTRLQNIRNLGVERDEARRDRDVARYLVAELQHEHARALVSSMEKELVKLKERYAGDEARLIELNDLVKAANDERDRLVHVRNEMPGGALYGQMAIDCRKLEEKLATLRGICTSVDDRLRKRIKDARSWLKDMRAAPVPAPLDTHRFAESIENLAGCEVNASSNALARLSEVASQLVTSLRRAFASDQQELERLRAEKNELASQIKMLGAGLPPVPQPLLNRLNDRLLPVSGQNPARALRELCEVADESWREAIEVAFTEKFAVIVGEEQYAEALRHYHELEAAAHDPRAAAESLIHPAQMLAQKTKVVKGSLAEKIETAHPVARAVIDVLFGQVMCVKKLADFEKHSAAIFPDGLMIRDAVVRRARRYDGVPFVGKRGLQRQLEIKQSLLADMEAKLRRIEPFESAVNALIADKDMKVPDHGSLSNDFVRLEQLPQIEQEHTALMQKLAALDTGALKDLDEQAQDCLIQVGAYNKERDEILKKGILLEIKQNEKSLEARRKDASDREDAFSRTKREIDISAHLPRYQSWKAEMMERFLAPDVAAREFEKEERRTAETVVRAEGDLKTAMVEFKRTFTPRFDDLPEDGHTTKDYEKLLARIDGQGIPEFEQKAQAERKRWEQLFRTQVLSRMQQALKRVEDIIFRLNKNLKHPIGHDRYKIEKTANPEYRFYRQLIDLNSLQQPDDLFFASMEGELKHALTTFLETLVRSGGGPEAAKLLDYRAYFDYDLFVSDERYPEAKPVSVDKQSGKFSGGENQSPYFVAILASYLHAYNRHESRWKEPSLALVPIDEAFSKLSGERIQDCLGAMQELDLQGVFSMSSGNIPFAFRLCDELIVVTKYERRDGSKTRVRNVPAVMFRDTPEGAAWLERHPS